MGASALRARDYFADFRESYGTAGVLPALDGADHFRLRKSLSAGYSRKRLAEQMDELYDHAAEAYGALEGWGRLPCDGHEPANDKRSNLTPHGRR